MVLCGHRLIEHYHLLLLLPLHFWLWRINRQRLRHLNVHVVLLQGVFIVSAIGLAISDYVLVNLVLAERDDLDLYLRHYELLQELK